MYKLVFKWLSQTIDYISPRQTTGEFFHVINDWTLSNDEVVTAKYSGLAKCRGDSSTKILGALPHHQSLHLRVHFLRSPKPKKINQKNLHLKSNISRIANSVIG